VPLVKVVLSASLAIFIPLEEKPLLALTSPEVTKSPSISYVPLKSYPQMVCVSDSFLAESATERFIADDLPEVAPPSLFLLLLYDFIAIIFL